MRTFEIPSMGGLMLTTRSNEQDKFFPENKASLMFKDIQNLTKKLNIY
jgi:spore maturation protein CgeB|tara:strand:+ start:364 stop:507 length:144 start_codon:yes stop_codon:yes gene_type:complete